MIIAGFDPGSISFGVGIVEVKGSRITFIHSEAIKFREKDFFPKMVELWHRLNEVCRMFTLDSTAIEEGFLGKNVRSMDVLAKVRGVVMGAMIHNDLNIRTFSPREVKKALTGNGNALKGQVKKMIALLLNLNESKISDDESDALAVAYCHALEQR